MNAPVAQLVVKTAQGLWIRPEPLRIAFAFNDLVSNDGHQLHVSFGVVVRVVNRPAEIQILTESLLSSAADVNANHVLAHFNPFLRASLAATAGKLTGQECLEINGKLKLEQAVLDGAKKAAFSCGLEVIPPCPIEIESPSIASQRAQSQRREVQRQALEQTAELFKKYEEIRKNSPSLSPGQVLEQLDPASGASLLQSLFTASAGQGKTDFLYVVAGPSLARFNLTEPKVTPVNLPVPQSLGPLRSLTRQTNGEVLVGARDGIYALNIADPANSIAFVVPNSSWETGFNRAIRWNEYYLATHSEAGIVCWREPSQPLFVLPPTQLLGESPRNLMALDDQRLIFSSGAGLFTLKIVDEKPAIEQVSPPATGEVLWMGRLNDRLLILSKDGNLQHRDAGNLKPTEHRSLGTALSAGTLMPWLDSSRLLAAEDGGRLLCVGLEDSLTSQFVCGYAGYRQVVATQDRVAALTVDRNRILIWNAGEPARPALDLHIPSLCRHRAADLMM